MSAHTANHPGPSTVVDLQARRPAAPASTVAVRRRKSCHWTILVIEGEMDVRVLPFLPVVDGSDTAHLVVKLHGVTSMDTAALDALVDMQRKALSAGGCVRLVAPSRPVLRLLMETGAGHLFRTFDTLDQALSARATTEPERVS